jgi:hypothetical protein
MKTTKPRSYFFDMIDKQMKQHEEKLKRKNNTIPAKNK